MPDESVRLPLPMFTFTVPAVSASTVSGSSRPSGSAATTYAEPSGFTLVHPLGMPFTPSGHMAPVAAVNVPEAATP